MPDMIAGSMEERRNSLLLLGRPTLRCGSEGISVALPDKTFVMFALLYLSEGRRMSRETLAEMLYEEAQQSGARANLRQLLSRLQRRQGELGFEVITLADGEVRLKAGPSVPECDLDELREAGTATDADSLQDSIRRYRGEFLEGMTGNGESLDGWIRAQRTRLRDEHVDRALAAVKTVRGSAGEAAARALIDADPYREDVWRALIELRAETHGVGAAFSIFDEMRERFSAELGAVPEAQTLDFVGSLRLRATGFETRQGDPRTYKSPSGEGPEPRANPVVPKLCLLMPGEGSADPIHVGLASALVEDVTLGLCRLRSVAVIAPYTAWHLSGGSVPPADRFDISYWGETDIRSIGGTVRMMVRLVRAADRVMLWADEFDLRVGAPSDHYRTLSQSLILALANAVERAEQARFDMIRPAGAYQLYLAGRRHLRVLDLPDVRRARKWFARSADAEPLFAPALCGLARTLTLEWLLLARTETDLLEQARRIARRAVEIDPLSGEALRERGSATLFLGGIDEAVDDLARAGRLAPHHADVLADHANALTHGSELPSALERIETAIGLNPVVPDDYRWTAGSVLFLMKQYEEALSHLQKMRRQEPARRLMAACFAKSGRRDEAAGLVKRALEDQPNFRIRDWIAAIPLKSKDHVEHYANALGEAGFV